MINWAEVLKSKMFQTQQIFLKTLEEISVRLFNLFQARVPLSGLK